MAVQVMYAAAVMIPTPGTPYMSGLQVKWFTSVESRKQFIERTSSTVIAHWKQEAEDGPIG